MRHLFGNRDDNEYNLSFSGQWAKSDTYLFILSAQTPVNLLVLILSQFRNPHNESNLPSSDSQINVMLSFTNKEAS